jgi:hypothetical protein
MIIDAIPEAAPEVFANVAHIRPKPIEHSDSNPIKTNANKNPVGLKLTPNMTDNTVIIATCKRASNILEIIWLPINSPDVVRVVLILLINPWFRSSTNAIATVMMRYTHVNPYTPGSMTSNILCPGFAEEGILAKDNPNAKTNITGKNIIVKRVVGSRITFLSSFFTNAVILCKFIFKSPP